MPSGSRTNTRPGLRSFGQVVGRIGEVQPAVRSERQVVRRLERRRRRPRATTSSTRPSGQAFWIDGTTHDLGPPGADRPAVLGDVDRAVAAEHAGVGPAAADRRSRGCRAPRTRRRSCSVYVSTMTIRPSGRMSGPSGWPSPLASVSIGRRMRVLLLPVWSDGRRSGARALLEQLDGVAVGIGHVAAAGALVRAGGDVDDAAPTAPRTRARRAGRASPRRRRRTGTGGRPRSRTAATRPTVRSMPTYSSSSTNPPPGMRR